MRSLLLLVIAFGACDLQPPPPKKAPAAPPAGSDAPAPSTTPPPPPPALPDAGAAPALAPDAMETTAACTEVAARIAGSVIDSAQDPAQKAALTQERDRIVRRVAEACTRDAWSEASRACFLKAKTSDEMQACGKDLAAPRDE